MKKPVKKAKILVSPAATLAFGRQIAASLRPGDVLLLIGNLGAGKTVLTKGIARGLGIRQPITSPTFVIRKRYPLPSPRRGIKALNHVDAYRFSSADELRGVVDELIQDTRDEVWCIEWGGQIRSALGNAKTRHLHMTVVDASTRKIIERAS